MDLPDQGEGRVDLVLQRGGRTQELAHRARVRGGQLLILRFERFGIQAREDLCNPAGLLSVHSSKLSDTRSACKIVDQRNITDDFLSVRIQSIWNLQVRSILQTPKNGYLTRLYAVRRFTEVPRRNRTPSFQSLRFCTLATRDLEVASQGRVPLQHLHEGVGDVGLRRRPSLTGPPARRRERRCRRRAPKLAPGGHRRRCLPKTPI